MARDAQPQRLAIDLDGVLTEHPRPLAHAAAAHFGISLPDNAFVDSAGLNVPIEVRDWVYGEEGPASSLQPAPGAQAFLARLLAYFGDGNIRIVTARPENSATMTRAWLRRHQFPECDILFGDDKCRIAGHYGLVLAIEDSQRHARNYAAAGLTCYLLGVEELTFGVHPRIVLVDSLDDLADQLMPPEEEDSASTASDDEDRGDAGSSVQSVSATVASNGRRPTIVVSDAIHPSARAKLLEAADLVDVDGTDREALLASLTEADALVVRSETQVTTEVLAAGPHLRVVARAGVGVDNIDVPAATRAGVLVLNAPGANAVSAGEHTISLLLAITRQLIHANASTKAGKWERKKIKPIDLKGRTVGIVGLGHVGSVVAQRLLAFEMNVIAYDPFITDQRFADLGVERVDFDTLLMRSDVVTLHVPHTPATSRMLDAAALAKLKPTAIVLNCARGEVVDQEALAAALREGRIAAAGVDVHPHEPCTESPLFDLPNVIVTPHTGGSSAEALAAVGEMISWTTLAALRGEAVPNAVNMPATSVHAADLQRLTTVAGAAGNLLAILQDEQPAVFTVTTQGLVPPDVAEHVTSAALSEALQTWTDRRVTAVNARLVAQEAGMRVKSVSANTDPAVLPQFTFEASGEVTHRVTVTWDRTNAGILEVDRFSLERPLADDVLITHHRDQPGVIGRMGTILGRYEVNIAGMQVGRHQRGGEAMMVLNVDDAIPAGALEEIKAIPGVQAAYVVHLPPAAPRNTQAPSLASVGR